MAEKIKKGKQYDMEVHDMAFGGKGICRWATEHGQFIIFIPNTIPGQIISARIVKLRKNHAEARLMKVLQKSPMEIETGYQEVSGAPFATLSMEKQQFYKQRDSLDQFSRIGHEEISEVFTEYIPSPKDWAYRNKMEYSFSAIIWGHEEDKAIDGFGLGFKRRGMWWCVDDLKKPSGLFDLEFENSLQKIKAYCEATGLTAWHAPRAHGFFRSMVVRYSFAEDKFLVALQTSGNDEGKFSMESFAHYLNKLFPGRIAGVIHTLNEQEGDRFNYTDGASTLISGQDHIYEELCGLRFKISLSSFFQTNPASAEKLYSSVIDLCRGLPNKGVIMDLFCGTGTIAQLLSKAIKGPKIIGVDIEVSSIADAKMNAHLNGLDDLEFHAADVGKFLSEHPEFKGQISTIILDPPRAGIAPKSLNKVIDLEAKDIIYVSCNPSTQARDTSLLKEAGYKLTHYHLVDQFPHTSHIEGVAVFSKN